MSAFCIIYWDISSSTAASTSEVQRVSIRQGGGHSGAVLEHFLTWQCSHIFHICSLDDLSHEQILYVWKCLSSTWSFSHTLNKTTVPQKSTDFVESVLQLRQVGL